MYIILFFKKTLKYVNRFLCLRSITVVIQTCKKTPIQWRDRDDLTIVTREVWIVVVIKMHNQLTTLPWCSSQVKSSLNVGVIWSSIWYKEESFSWHPNEIEMCDAHFNSPLSNMGIRFLLYNHCLSTTAFFLLPREISRTWGSIQLNCNLGRKCMEKMYRMQKFKKLQWLI